MSSVEFRRQIRGRYCLHLQAEAKQDSYCLLALFTIPPSRWRQQVPSKPVTRLHGVTCLKLVFFIVAAARTSNPTVKPCYHLSYEGLQFQLYI
jgi:hypothetical protein